MYLSEENLNVDASFSQAPENVLYVGDLFDVSNREKHRYKIVWQL